MKRIQNRSVLALALSATLLPAFFAMPARAAEPAIRDEPVYKVDNVTAVTAPGGKLLISAQGAVRTGGWSNAALRPDRAHGNPHLLSFDFIAVPPSQDAAVIQAIVPIDASITIKMPRARVTAVTVTTETNGLTTQIHR